MSTVRLRPVERSDLPVLAALRSEEHNPMDFFGFRAANALEKGFEDNGLLTDDHGTLAVLDPEGTLIGTVGWAALRHGPSRDCQALNIGIGLLPSYRGKGYGTAAQAEVARYLFACTTVERLEASTDVENLAEQRALEKAGFVREGVLRHAQFRAGGWRDLVLFSRLRGDPAPG